MTVLDWPQSAAQRTGLSVNLMQPAIVAPDQTQLAECARKYQRSAGISNFIERTAERANELPFSVTKSIDRGRTHFLFSLFFDLASALRCVRAVRVSTTVGGEPRGSEISQKARFSGGEHAILPNVVGEAGPPNVVNLGDQITERLPPFRLSQLRRLATIQKSRPIFQLGEPTRQSIVSSTRPPIGTCRCDCTLLSGPGGHGSEIKPETAKCPTTAKTQARVMTQPLPIH
jgi:hypothetical protein